MHKTERWVLFPYLAMDYKAAEDWLNQQARAGWRVASFDLKGWTVYLLPADRPDIRYCVDLSGEKARNQESYLALCHEAGWGLVETVRSMNVFCALPGADPAPIQTDPGLERDRFERIYFWKSWLLLLFMLLFPPLLLSLLWLLLEGGDPAFWYSFPLFLLSSPEGAFSALFCALAAAVVLWQLGSMLRYFLRCRAAVRSGGEMPVPSARQARLRGTGEFLLLIAYVLLLVLRLVDMSAPSYPVTYFPEERGQSALQAGHHGGGCGAASRRSAGEAGGDRLPPSAAYQLSGLRRSGHRDRLLSLLPGTPGTLDGSGPAPHL